MTDDTVRMDASTKPLSQDDIAAGRKLREAYDHLKKQLARVIVGQNEVIEEMLIALFCRGHCILEGVPGLAKTLMIATSGQVLVTGFQPHSVHARPDAVRHHRHAGHRGES